MNDRLPPSPSDEDLSAAIDGEADAEVLARIAEDPVALARQDQLARAARAVADSPPVPLDAAVVDDLVSQALAADAAPVTPTNRRAPAPWLVAAAVIVLLGLGLTLIWSGRDTGGEDLATGSVADAPAETERAAEPGTASEDGGTDDLSPFADAAESQAGTADPAATGTAEITDLGVFASKEELRSSLAADQPDPAAFRAGGAARSSAVGAPSPRSVARCREQLSVTLELDADPIREGFAELDGAAVLIYEFPAPSFADGTPTSLVAAVGADACQPILLFER